MVRLVSILVLCAALGAGWFYAWQWGAGELERRMAGIEDRLEANGGSLECRNRRIEGFPFRIGIFCDGVDFDAPDGTSYYVGPLRSAAQFYDPGRIVAEIDAPASVQLPDARRFLLGYVLMRASLRLNLSGLSALSIDIRKPVLSGPGAGDGAGFVASSEAIEIHARKSPTRAGALDLALRVDRLADRLERFPGLSVDGDVELADIADRLKPGFDLAKFVRENGLAGNGRRIVISPDDGGKLILSGPFSVSPDGVVDGQIRIEASDLPGLGAFFLQLFPERAETINNAVSLISAIVPESGEALAKGAAPAFTLTIRSGQASLGLIPLGEVPRLF